MRQFELARSLFECSISACIVRLEQGIQVTIAGGQLPHIGAVSVVDSAGDCKTVEFPGHRDSAISKRWAEVLFQATLEPVVVVAGIHYDQLSREGIDAVLQLTEEMLCFVLSELSE